MTREFVPRPEQELMLAWLRKMPRKALHAGCGSGKTVTTLTYVADTLHDRMSVGRWGIVAPKTVADDVWQREAARWKHLAYLEQPRLVTFDDLDLRRKSVDGRAAGLEFAVKKDVKRHLRSLKDPIHVMSYQTFVWIVEACGANFPYDGLVFDESTFVKDLDSKRYRAAKKACNWSGLVNDVIELSGTPIPKGYEDLVAQFMLLDTGKRLGKTKHEFRDNWCAPGKRGRGGVIYSWDVRDDALPHIQRRIGELAVSVDHDTGIELVESAQFVKLPPAARKTYDAMKRDLLIELDGKTIISANAAVLIGKLMQICNGYVYDQERGVHLVHTAKLDAVVEALDAATSPVLLSYAYKPDELALQKRLGKRMRLAKEPGTIEAFRRGEVEVMGFHPETLSFGVDGLQGASNTVFWYGPTHRFDWYFQVYKRLQREGSNASKVFVRTFVAEDTIEPGIIDNVLAPKGERNDGLLRAIRAN